MFCTKCGAELKDGSMFCHICGAQLEAEEPRAVTPAPKTKTPVNRIVILIEIIATVALGLLIMFWLMGPQNAYETDASPAKRAADTADSGKKITPAAKDNKPATPTPTDTPTPLPPTPTPTDTPTPTPMTAPKDTGKTLRIENGIFLMDGSILGMTYDELNEYFGGAVPDLQYWEWSSVPLWYTDITYRDGNSYCLFFENNRLVSVRYETGIAEDVIPSDLLDRLRSLYNDPHNGFMDSQTNRRYEYDWYNIGGVNGEFSVFLNPYDDLNHLCQQYTSWAFSGDNVQSR